MSYTITLPDGSTRTTTSQTMANAMATNSGGTVSSSPTSSSATGQSAASQQHSQDAYNNSYQTFIQQNPQFANPEALNQHIAGGGSSVMPAHDGGWAYTDKYGFSHVVADRATAEQYANHNSLTPYYGSFSGGYAVTPDGQRMMVNTPGAIPFGNDGNRGTMKTDNYGTPLGGYVGGQFYNPNEYLEAIKRFQQQNAYIQDKSNAMPTQDSFSNNSPEQSSIRRFIINNGNLYNNRGAGINPAVTGNASAKISTYKDPGSKPQSIYGGKTVY